MAFLKKSLDKIERIISSSPPSSPKNAPSAPIKLTIAVIGDTDTGKTTFVNSIMSQAFGKTIAFNETVDGFNVYTLDYILQDKKFIVTLLDGSDFCKTYNSTSDCGEKTILDSAKGIFMSYDVSNIKSYESVERKWKTMLDKRKMLDSTSIVIVGLKEDLPAQLDRTLIKMINKYCEEELVCSSKNNQGIQECISTMICCIMNRANSVNEDVSIRSNVGDSPHTFVLHYFPKPTWCQFCDLFIFGVSAPQGYLCTKCKYAVHKKCKDNVPMFCGLDK